MINKKLGIAVLALVATQFANKAQAASDNGSSSATIVASIAITANQELAFGKISAGASSGTVVMSVAGTRSATGGATLVATGSTQSQGTFDVSGEAGATYSISLPADGTVTLSDGASHTMAVGSFVSNPAVGTGGTLDGSGAQTLNVGATLSVAANQVAGSYTGTYPVSVDYN